MRVLLVATLDPRGGLLGRWFLQAFRKLGHEANAVDLRTPWSARTAFLGLLRMRSLAAGKDLWSSFRDGQREGRRADLNRRLLRAIQLSRPDLLFVIKGVSIEPEVIAEARRRNVLTACWWVDDPMDFDRSWRSASWYDAYFTNCPRSVEEYRRRGLKAVFHLTFACDPDWDRRVTLTPRAHQRWGSDGCFIGTHHPVREKMLTRLVEFDVKIWGSGWRKKIGRRSSLRRAVQGDRISREDMVRAYNAAALGINVHSWLGTYDHILNQRTFEMAGCGAAQLVDWKEEVTLYFREDEEVVCYRNEEELLEKARYYLTHPVEREALGKNAQRRAYQEHTYSHRVLQLLEALRLG